MFVLWGGIHGLGQLVEDLFTRRDRSGRVVQSKRTHRRGIDLVTLIRWGITLLFVNFAWIFFRAPSIGAAVDFLKLFVRNGGVNDLVLPVEELRILALGIAVLAIFDLIKRRKGQTPDDYLITRRLSTEWGVIIFLIVCIFVFGEYGPTFDPKAFIYFQF